MTRMKLKETVREIFICFGYDDIGFVFIFERMFLIETIYADVVFGRLGYFGSGLL